MSQKNNQEDTELKELMSFLASRIEPAKQGELSTQSMDSLIAKAKSQRRP